MTATPLAKPLAHSHSSLENYELCPHQYLHARILKTIPYEQNAAGAWGDYAHKQFEAYCKGEIAVLPDDLAMYTPQVDRARQTPGVAAYEPELCINTSMEPCGWWDKNVLFRSKHDVLVLDEPCKQATIIDWKLGKSRNDKPTQPLRYACLVFVTYPWVEFIETTWIYLPENLTKRVHFTRKDIDKLAFSVIDPIERIDYSVQAGHWPKKPGGLCGKYCGELTCEHNGRNK